MDNEVMDMDTGSDPHSDVDEPSVIPETPPSPPWPNAEVVSEVKTSVRCNFNVVIDIEEDAADGERFNSVPQQDSNVENLHRTTENSLSESAEIGNCDKESGSDTDFEEPIEETSVLAPETDYSAMASDELNFKSFVSVPQTKSNDEKSSVAKEKREMLVEQRKQERIMLEQNMKSLEPKRKEALENLKKMSPAEKIFPSVHVSKFHTVAFLMTNDYKSGDPLKPFPVSFVYKWDPEYVPMPCCRQNTRVVKVRITTRTEDLPQNSNGEQREERVCIVWELIEDALSRPLLSCRDIELSLKQYCRSFSEFAALTYAIENIMTNSERENFFSKVLPVMQTLCLDLKSIVTCPIPLLLRFMNHSISLSQKQIACLLANAFFSTFPKRLEDELMYPTINFNELFMGDSEDPKRLVVKAHKIRCILHYFERIVEEMPKGVVTYTRKSIRNSKAPDWKNCTKKLTKMVALLDGTIETDGAGLLGVDFANKIIGGGVLGRGAVQEEILFVIYPELLLTRLFTEKLTACEAVLVTGCERFSQYSGYSNNFQYAGDFYDCTPWDLKGRKCTQITAIDALYISRPISQFHPRFLKRELDKAYVGFSSPNATQVGVATGKWGCGAFQGDPLLKSILQWLAASLAGRDVALFTFGDSYLLRDIENVVEVIKDNTIQDVWSQLEKYNDLFCSSRYSSCSLVEFFTQYSTGGNGVPFNQEEELPYFEDKEVPSTSTFKEVPITRFYKFTDKTAKPTSRETEKEPKKLPNRTPSEDIGSSSKSSTTNESWLDTLDLVKTSLTPNSNFKLKNCGSEAKLSHRRDEALSDAQIANLLMEDESKDTEKEDTKAVKRYKSSKSGNCSPDAIREPVTTNRMGKSASSPSSIAALCSTAPKQKKPATLKDFFS